MQSSVLPIISLWEEFSRKRPNGNVHEFATWVLKENRQSSSPAKGNDARRISKKGTESSEITQEGRAMLLIYRLHRFMEMRSKPVIKKIGFAKPHEFAMLAEIFLLQKPNKKEIANKMLLEVSTTVEITKRLVGRGFVREVSDPNDKRATRLVITEKGMKKLYESYEGLENVHSNFLDSLNQRDRSELLRLLEELERFQSALLENSV